MTELAMISASVVLPNEGGPIIVVIRPRGSPPPNTKSSDRLPVGIRVTPSYSGSTRPREVRLSRIFLSRSIIILYLFSGLHISSEYNQQLSKCRSAKPLQFQCQIVLGLH